MGNVLVGIGNLGLGASLIVCVLGGLVFLAKGMFSQDTAVRAGSFGAAKGAGLGFLALLLLLPIIMTIGMGFQANVTLDGAMSFVGIATLSLIVTVTLMIRGYNEAG